jgi:hypothetical protein
VRLCTFRQGKIKMELKIVGVGQTFDFNAGQMINQIQVQKPNGEVVSVPTTQETVQALIGVVVGGPGIGQVSPTPTPKPTLDHAYAGGKTIAWEEPVSPPTPTTHSPAPVEGQEFFPEGAIIFGNEKAPVKKAVPVIGADKSRFSSVVERPKPPSSLAVRRDDGPSQSGVPSYTLARVDNAGNPILPPPPEIFVDEDEDFDQGEQI